MSNQELWSGVIRGKTCCDKIVYFANLTDTQIWWDNNPSYAAVCLSDEFYDFIQKVITQRCNFQFENTTEMYSMKINISEVGFMM